MQKECTIWVAEANLKFYMFLKIIFQSLITSLISNVSGMNWWIMIHILNIHVEQWRSLTRKMIMIMWWGSSWDWMRITVQSVVRFWWVIPSLTSTRSIHLWFKNKDKRVSTMLVLVLVLTMFRLRLLHYT